MRIISSFIGLFVTAPYGDECISKKTALVDFAREYLVKIHELEDGSFVMEYHDGKRTQLKQIERKVFDLLRENLSWKP